MDKDNYDTKLKAEIEIKEKLRADVLKKVEKAVAKDEAYIVENWLDVYNKLP